MVLVHVKGRGVPIAAAVFFAIALQGSPSASEPQGGALPESPTSAFSAEDYFERARDVWTAQRYPERLNYAVAVRVSENGAPLQNHYQGSYSAASGEIRVFAFSEEETANPFEPHGINVFLTLAITQGGTQTLSHKLSRDPPVTDYLGIPVVQPAYSFGLARRRPNARALETARSTNATILKTIGSVSSRHRDYDISLVRIELDDGVQVAHLALRPIRDPMRYRLRQMWVDTGSFATRKIITEGNFSEGPPLRVAWTTTFMQIDGMQYIDTESTDAPLDYGPGRRYRGASISFERVRPDAARIPPLLLSKVPARPDELREPDL